MGIESEQLVYDYLSRVGDLAQQRGLPSGDRMRLVAELRADIDQRRASAGSDSPAGVKRILAKLGTPAEVVAAAGGRPSDGAAPDGGAAGAGAAAGAGSVGGAYGGAEPPRGAGAAGMARAARDKLSGFAERSGLIGKVPAPRDGDSPARPESPSGAAPTDDLGRPSPRRRSPAAASPPHLAGEDELGPRESNPDWWHVEPGPFVQAEQRDSPLGQVEGFVGGVEIPELLGFATETDTEAEEAAGADTDQGADEAEADTGGGKAARKPGLLRRALRRRGAKGGGGGDGEGGGAQRAGFLSPLVLLAAALLVAGAALGNLIVMAFGWVIAYSTRKLSRAEVKWAVLGMPGLVAAATMAWLWGRASGKWGEPIPENGMGDALRAAWPVVVRAAAITSAFFLVWRARRRR
ncbi:HAAS signaling domain-containing protein [Streptomyces sp. LZ34]